MVRTLQIAGLGVLATAAFIVGCQRQTELEPMPQAGAEVIGDEVVVNELAGVALTVDGDAWEGSDMVEQAVTPVWVEVVNSSTAPLAIEYPNFVLAGASESYEALPVFPVEMVGDEPVLVEGYVPVTEHEFEVITYYVAPYLAPAYPAVEPYVAAFDYDDTFYTRTYAFWQGTDLPDATIRAAALPEGVLPAGATISGYLFFERVPATEEKVNLLAALENAESHELMGTLRIALEPELSIES